jgi:2-dehydropantoate 2-reductase
MLYDRLAGRPLEHEELTGAVVRRAEAAGVDVPLSRAVLTLLRLLDRSLRREARVGAP